MDVTDLLVLYDHVVGTRNPVTPAVDVLYDGRAFAIETLHPSEEGDWSGEIHAPPREGEGAKPADLDGNPETVEWTFPCTTRPAPGNPPDYYYTTVAYGPRQPGVTPSGSNSALIRMFVCLQPTGIRFLPFIPIVKPIGQCMYPCGENVAMTMGLVSPIHVWTSTDPESGQAWRFTFDSSDCTIKIERDKDGDGTFETHVHSGKPLDWDGWHHIP